MKHFEARHQVAIKEKKSGLRLHTPAQVTTVCLCKGEAQPTLNNALARRIRSEYVVRMNDTLFFHTLQEHFQGKFGWCPLL